MGGGGDLPVVSALATLSPFPPQVAKAVTQALNRCVSCLPGQRDVDNALRAVGDASKRLLSDSVGGQGCEGDVGTKHSKYLPRHPNSPDAPLPSPLPQACAHLPELLHQAPLHVTSHPCS